MAERRRAVPEESGLEASLRIDRDDLDGGLIEQPDHYYKAAMAHVEAEADRDAAKLAFEHLQANLDVQIRTEAAKAEEKVTETGIQREMQLDERYHAARLELLRLEGEVARRAALKEAFRERSKTLANLVSLAITDQGNRSGAAGAYETRARQAQEALDVRREGFRSRRERSRDRGGPSD